MPVVVDPLIHVVMALGFAALFLMSAQHKIKSFARFGAIVAEYRLLPAGLTQVASGTAIAAELAVGSAWVSSLWFEVSGAAVIGSAVLLAGYAVAIAINLARGRVHISCGCGFGAGSAEDQPLSAGLVVRNGLLVAAALGYLLPDTGRALGWFDFAIALIVLLALVVIYFGASQLLQNRHAMSALAGPFADGTADKWSESP